MRSLLYLATATSIIAGATAAGAAPLPVSPPLLTGDWTAAQINERCDLWIKRTSALRSMLEGARGASTVATTLTPYDRLNELLRNASGEAIYFRETASSAAAREAGGKCEVAIDAEDTKLSLSKPIYERLKAVRPPADAKTRYFLARSIASFERAGVGLDDAGRARVQQISEKASTLGTTFDANNAKGQRQITATAAELDGLPADFIAAHKPGADGKIVLRTDLTDYIPVMTYAKNRALRERFYRTFQVRAYPENDPVLVDLINTRDDLAKLVGRPNYAALNFENRMLNTPAKVQSLMDDMAAAAKPAAARDYAKKLALLQRLYPGATKLEPWDNGFVSQLVQKESYGFDRQEARKYFAYDNVRDGTLRLTEQMFGVDIRPWKTPVQHSSVEAYEMFDKGRLIGRFFLDSHPREGKYEHANAITIRTGTRTQVPVSVLVMNLPAGDHRTGLMEHNDVTIFLHEYGHLLHAIFGGQKQRWATQSGVSTEWDFVEAPSQMLENWTYDYDVLKTFAVDEKGKVIPRDLVDAMNRSRYFSIGMDDMRQLGLTNISLGLYLGRAPADIGAATRALDNKYAVIPTPDYAQIQASFPHLNAYGAAYYTYRWSVVIADDLYTRFAKAGLLDRATAEQYRRMVLEPGGSKPAAELVKDFLGRPVSIDAYRAKMDKDQ